MSNALATIQLRDVSVAPGLVRGLDRTEAVVALDEKDVDVRPDRSRQHTQTGGFCTQTPYHGNDCGLGDSR